MESAVYWVYMPPQDATLSWVVQTHEHRDRSTDWYWALGLIAVVAAGLSLFFSNVLFALIILVGAASIGTLVSRGPRQHGVRIDPRGISVDGTLYRYDAVDSFWVEQQPQKDPRLLVTTRGVLHPQLVIPLESRARAEQVRGYLKRHATEEEQAVHLGAHLAELFGL